MQSSLKQNVLSPLLFNFALEYATRKVKENEVGLKINGTHQLLSYADDVSLLLENINTVKKNTETLIYSRNEVRLEVNAEKTNIYCYLVTIMHVKLIEGCDNFINR
jgi:nitrous oxide reductase